MSVLSFPYSALLLRVSDWWCLATCVLCCSRTCGHVRRSPTARIRPTGGYSVLLHLLLLLLVLVRQLLVPREKPACS